MDLKDVSRQLSQKYAFSDQAMQEHGNPIGWAEWELSSDMKYMLVKANYLKVALSNINESTEKLSICDRIAMEIF